METIAGTAWPVERARLYVEARVTVADGGCWLWTGALRKGYGAIRAPQRHDPARPTLGAHRVAYEVFVGPIPDGLLVCHRCDVRACCNPDHMFLGTQSDNMLDMYTKRRGRSKLTASEALAVYADTRPQQEIASDFGITQGLVSHIKRGRVWSSVTGHAFCKAVAR